MTLFVLGNSHARPLFAAARYDGGELAGDCLGPGRLFNLDFYTRTPGDFRFNACAAEAAYRSALHGCGAKCMAELRATVICLFATNFHYLARDEVWGRFAVNVGGAGQFISAAVVRAAVCAQLKDALSFHRELIDMGIQVMSALPPRRASPSNPVTRMDVFVQMEDIVLAELQAMGVHMIDHRPWSLDEQGALWPQYAATDDPVHGSVAFGRRLLSAFQQKANLLAANHADTR